MEAAAIGREREAQQYNKKICGPQFSIIALWIFSSVLNELNNKKLYTRVNFILFFFFCFSSSATFTKYMYPAIIFFSLYLCTESIHFMYLIVHNIVSEWNERCTFEPDVHIMHNHPSLIHSYFPFFILSLTEKKWKLYRNFYNVCMLAFLLILSCSSDSFGKFSFLLLLFFRVVIVYVSNSFFWCNAYNFFVFEKDAMKNVQHWGMGCQWWT